MIDYKKVLPPIIHGFKAIGGKLTPIISTKRKNTIEAIGIALEIVSFEYSDPFYGRIKADNNLQEFLNIDCATVGFFLEKIDDLENKEVKPEFGSVTGWFSNSIQTIPIKIRFGKINLKNEIGFHLEYFLTNGEEYACLTGSMKEHSLINGEVQTNLSLESPFFKKDNI